MKSLLSNTILILLIRVLLGGLFIVASLDKIVHPDAFAAAVLNYKIIGSTLSMVTATILPWLELLSGLGLILGISPRASAMMITALLTGFTILLAVTLARGLDISCGCFTQDPNVGKIGYQKILENCGLILLGIFLLFTRDDAFRLFPFFRRNPDQPANS